MPRAAQRIFEWWIQMKLRNWIHFTSHRPMAGHSIWIHIHYWIKRYVAKQFANVASVPFPEVRSLMLLIRYFPPHPRHFLPFTTLFQLWHISHSCEHFIQLYDFVVIRFRSAIEHFDEKILQYYVRFIHSLLLARTTTSIWLKRVNMFMFKHKFDLKCHSFRLSFAD